MTASTFRRAALGLLSTVAILGAVAQPATAGAAARAGAGAAGLGDPFFPLAGNGGYDVAHYALTLDYVRAGNTLSGTAVITAKATQDLNRFDLDLRGFTVSQLTVDGAPATFRRDGQELVITPAKPLGAGGTFVVRVAYRGQPTEIVDPDGSPDGWITTPDGAFVANEPQGAPAWFPANDNPRDKATFEVSITVPKGITAMGNGVLRSHEDHGGKTTWVWAEDSPMAPYLATVTNGVFDLHVDHAGQLPLYHAVDPKQDSAEGFKRLAADAEIIQFLAGIYGPYPFSAAGGVIDDALAVGYALETQSKPLYPSLPDTATIAHETSHQWFGDSVSLNAWPDIWLNEGFATWSEWIYAERHGGQSAQATFDQELRLPAGDGFWATPPAKLGGAADLFGSVVYTRGAMTLQALRAKIGDPKFFQLLRTWCADHRNGNATTADFIALAKKVSGQNLDKFFQVWLYAPAKPKSW
jgi:aminopeptidase N